MAPARAAALHVGILSWLSRCERRVWLELYGDRAHKVADSQVAVHRARAGLVHEAEMMRAMLAPAQPLEAPDWPALVAATLTGMRAGAAQIQQGALETATPTGLRLYGRPDVLRRVERPSQLGAWSYEPIEVKEHREATPRDRLQLDLYRWQLGHSLGHTPDGELWLGEQDGAPAVIERQEGALTVAEQQLRRASTLTPEQEPHVWFARHCSYCPWRQACDQRAAERQDIALLTGLDKRAATSLRARGITTLAPLAAQPAARLEQTRHIGPTLAPQLLARARALLSGAPVRAAQPQPALPPAALFFDVESHPSTQEPWAFGWLTVDRTFGMAIVAPERPADAPAEIELDGARVVFVPNIQAGWRRVAQQAGQQHGQIFHWGNHERGDLIRSAPAAVSARLKGRLADLHRAFTLRYTLPIPRGATQTGGSLKAVGAYLGEQWPAEVDWAVSWTIYSQWRALLQSWEASLDAELAPAVRYLRADVAALLRVWGWLKQQEQIEQTEQLPVPS